MQPKTCLIIKKTSNEGRPLITSVLLATEKRKQIPFLSFNFHSKYVLAQWSISPIFIFKFYFYIFASKSTNLKWKYKKASRKTVVQKKPCVKCW